MDNINSLSSFFYNLVPGSLFALVSDMLLKSMYKDHYDPKGNERILLIVILGLFFGFLFQAITKYIRKHIPSYINQCLLNEIINKDKDTYGKAEEILINKELLINKLKNKQKIQRNFYLMDSYLRAKAYNETTERFAAKSAFWSNIALASFLLFIIMLFKQMCLFSIIPLIFSFVSLFFSVVYWRDLYDVIMKTFIAILQIDRK